MVHWPQRSVPTDHLQIVALVHLPFSSFCFWWTRHVSLFSYGRELPLSGFPFLGISSCHLFLTDQKVEVLLSIWLFCDVASGHLAVKVIFIYSQGLLTDTLEGQGAEHSFLSPAWEPFLLSVTLTTIPLGRCCKLFRLSH